MTLSRAGIPFGNSEPRRASRLTLPADLRRCRTAAVLSLRAWVPRVAVVLRAVVVRPPAALLGFLAELDGREETLRRARACVEEPATPCTRLRCAPSEAARVKLLPHSGQTNSPLAFAAADLRGADLAELFFAELFFAELFFRAALFERGLAIIRLSLDLVCQASLSTNRNAMIRLPMSPQKRQQSPCSAETA